MNLHTNEKRDSTLPTGPAAAAVLAAGAGCFAMGVFYVLGNVSAAANRVLSIYSPAGALSGASAATCLVWLGVWAFLRFKWRGRDVEMRKVSAWSFALLIGGLLLTFPPIARLF